MALLGQKRHRPARTLSVRGPETLLHRITRVFRDRGLMGRVGLCLLAIVLMLAAVQSWRVPFPYREGQRIADGVAARTEFRVQNVSETDRLRADAESRAPFIFRNDPTLLDPLPENLRAALVAIEQAQSVDQLDKVLVDSFGLGPTAGSEAKGAEQFAALKAAASKFGQRSAQERITTLVEEFTNFLQPIATNGIISPEDVRELQIRTDQPPFDGAGPRRPRRQKRAP